MKLHVGCGDVILPGWINVDLENLPGIDLQDDIRELKKVKNRDSDLFKSCVRSSIKNITSWNTESQYQLKKINLLLSTTHPFFLARY